MTTNVFCFSSLSCWCSCRFCLPLLLPLLLLLLLCSLLGRGLYALQLQPWLEAFGPDQMKVLFLEEMVQVGNVKGGCRWSQ